MSEQKGNIQPSTSTLPLGGRGAVFSKSDCLEHYTWGDDCHGWTFVDTEALSIKQELMPPVLPNNYTTMKRRRNFSTS